VEDKSASTVSVENQARRILQQAKSYDLTIVTAESCTAGAVATALSSAPGAADYFLGGFLTYTKKMKNKILRVPLKILKNKGAVCREVAEAMAAGALKLADADIAVSVTGVAGPELTNMVIRLALCFAEPQCAGENRLSCAISSKASRGMRSIKPQQRKR
jgi:PncC family amidohydrolase